MSKEKILSKVTSDLYKCATTLQRESVTSKDAQLWKLGEMLDSLGEYVESLIVPANKGTDQIVEDILEA